LGVNSSGTQFKLAPTYTLYMAVRYCISGGYRPDMSPHDRAHRVTGLVKKISHLVHQAVQVSGSSGEVTNTNVIMFGLTRSGPEAMIYYICMCINIHFILV
jgi:hypothetical protein